KRLEICGRLIEYLVKESEPDGVATAARLLDALFVGSEPAPVEVHLIRLWARDFDADKSKRPGPELMKLALQAHRLAEEAAIVGGGPANGVPAGQQGHPGIAAGNIAAGQT